MPVVIRKSGAYNIIDPADQSRDVIDTRDSEGKVRRVTGTITNRADDSNGSELQLVRLPTSAILLPETRLDLAALGFASVTIGVRGATTGLVGATSISGGMANTAPIAIFGAKWGIELWRQLGLAADPFGWLDLAVFATANATVAGSLKYDISWIAD